MPYTYRKEGDKYCIYKKDSVEKVGCTNGDKESLKKYLAALAINANENMNESIDIKNIHFKVNRDNTIDFTDTNKKLLGTLDLYGGFETESNEACNALVTLFQKFFKFQAKTEKTINGSPNILLSKQNIMTLLRTIKHQQNNQLNTVTELTQSDKTSQSVAIDTQIAKLQTQIAALQKKKEQLSKQSTTDEGISLSKLVKKIKEADTEDAPEKDAPEKEAPDTGNDAQDSANDDSQPKGLSIKFNMANVKKYNNYPVVDNTGTVTGVSKEGIAVLCGDNTVFVNFEDILNESKKIIRFKR